MKGERIQVNLNTGSLDSGSASFRPVYQVTDLQRGVWNDFVVHIVWSRSHGSIAVWHRTGGNPFQQQVDVSGIPTMQTLDGVVSRNYLKLGFYRNDEPRLTNVLYQDGFSRASTPAGLAPAFGGDPGFSALVDQIG
jgi:hypothetical protein